MFRIKVLNDSEWITIQDDKNKVVEPVLNEKLNSCGSLVYKTLITDKYFDLYKIMNTKVLVEEDGSIQFIGRLLNYVTDFNNTKELTFEGELALLNDVMYPPYDFAGTPAELLTNVINYYNSKCSSYNQIRIGRITVTDKNDYIARSCKDYSSCWEVISKKLIELCGGYIKLRWVLSDGEILRYIDYLEEPGKNSEQKIEFSKNLLDVNKEMAGDQICTVLIPLGAEDEDTKNRIDITSVNDGRNYIESQSVSLYGRIESVVIFNDVTIPENLLAKAQKYLQEVDKNIHTLKINAIDLHALNVDISRYNVGDVVNVYSKPHDIETIMLITERERNLNDPSLDSICLGKEEKTYTSNEGSGTKEDSITSVDIEYGISDSQTHEPSSWYTVCPEWQKDKYIWQRTVCRYLSGTVIYSDATCIQGANGTDGKDGIDGTNGKDGVDGANGMDGSDGRGIAAVIEEYYLSSSKTEVTGGVWQTECPKWKKGFYIWTRSKVTWMNPTEETYTEPILAGASNQANETANEALESIPTEDEIKGITKEQTGILLGMKGGYLEFLYEDSENPDIPTGLRIMDSKNKGSATNVILLNSGGFGFSNNGVEGPYFNAWTIDGRLSADAIYTGILQDRAGNFKLNMDTGEINVQRLTLNTPELIFGDLSNQYIKISNYSDSSGNKVGVLFDGTGQIIMTPEGKLDISNYVSNKLYNQFQMAYSSTGKQIYLWNKKQLDTNNANSISLQSTESANTFNVINYDLNSTYVGNQISLYSQKNSNYAYHTSELINRCVGNSYNANTLNFHSYKYDAGSWGNSITVDNYRKDNGVRANRLYIASSENYDFAEFGNIYQYSDGTYTYLPYINGIICQINKSDYINSLQIQNYPYENHNIRGNEIELRSNTVSSNGYRTIRIVNYNNDNDTVSNVIEMRKQDTSNYIDLSCFSAGISMATIQLSAFGNLNITTKDRTNHTHGIAIDTLGANGTYKDGAISINGHVLKFENGYVKYS